MLFQSLTTLLALGSMASAAPTTKAAARKLLVGGPGQLLLANFDGTTFEITGKNQTAGTAPSWMRFKGATNTLYAVDENSANLNLFTLDLKAKSDPKYASTVAGSAGVVFLEFNKDQTRMVGAAYGSATIDVWDVSATGAPKIFKQIPVNGTLGPGQTAHHPHQALLDPTGRFMVIPDLGGDQLLVLDTKDDKYEISGRQALFKGAGPRHGSFITHKTHTYYTVACELSNKVILFEITYTDAGMAFKEVSTQSTYGAGFGPANATSAAAGTVVVANSAAANKVDVYISNRLSGNATDSIAHFVFDADSVRLDFANSVSSGGILPRDMSLSKDEKVLFVANQGGENGLVALHRCGATGKLAAKPVAVKAVKELVAPGLEGQANVGPQFVQEI
ncbi:putative isomerase YbhE [Xylaria bambusicola]|uniref:putative isomerase YbhE n=1 Tax=Xylaria bambusicola TaxID=326684 RepID=UPI00200860AA|nr:putative isomerase YbhE [Xylaria bambusicola]KAI0512825.1 putative isomerase YbhE [Xylaria bambusicola]